MFKMEYMSLNLGVDLSAGGIVWYESAASGETVPSGGVVTLTKTPVAFNGALIGWYKKPSDKDWTVGTITQSGSTYTMTIPGVTSSTVYCIKYQYQDENAKSLTINAQYVPKVVHLVLLADLYSGDTADVGSSAKYGRIIVDIPHFQLAGSQSLNTTSTTAATMSLTGSALAVVDGITCEEAPYYGTMVEQVFSADWKNDVTALAIANDDIEMSSGEDETLEVWAQFGGMTIPAKKANSNFTFAVEGGGSTVVTVGANTGIVHAVGTGNATISVTLTGTDKVAHAYVTVS